MTIIASFYAAAQLPTASADDRSATAARYKFTELPIKLPPGLPEKHIRQVNPAYKHIQAWISSVGAGVAINDLAGTGKASDLCLVDPRSDKVIVTPVPGTGDRYQPFVLDPAPLPMDSAMAPTGCVPGDFNGDGRLDLLTYYLGRTPILYMYRGGSPTLSAADYLPTEVLPSRPNKAGAYTGERWQTTAAAVADFDGDGHPDVFFGNYFPDSDVLDPDGLHNVSMNDSMSRAENAGGSHLLRWEEATTGKNPSARFTPEVKAFPYKASTGWTLGAASADLDGDLLPELYVANDFGHDHMYRNVSTPGRIRFEMTEGERTPLTPKSMVMGHDSFKGMSADFGDFRGTGKYDLFVSNITVSWGIQESNFTWINQARDEADMRDKLSRGIAPFENHAAKLNMAWVGWGWDAKMGDFDNSGNVAIVQSDGFVKGSINRWSWLQELAMANDDVVANPKMWPKAEAGDDIAGNEVLAFWAKGPDGTYLNLTKDLGLNVPIPTRGVATADTTGQGRLDFAVARQWGPPAFYRNELPQGGAFLGLRLYRPVQGSAKAGLTVPGSPAYGAQVRITTADGHTHVSQLDGGSGHSGKRSFDVYFGLGKSSSPVQAELRWRDLTGQVHRQTLQLAPGWHNFVLDSGAQEVPSA